VNKILFKENALVIFNWGYRKMLQTKIQTNLCVRKNQLCRNVTVFRKLIT